ncbi:hypothetical protein QOT17_020551 [Balamuthia mandrillaris]
MALAVTFPVDAIRQMKDETHGPTIEELQLMKKLKQKEDCTTIPRSSNIDDWFSLLPDELVVHIFAQVPKEQINVLRMVNRRWKDLSVDRDVYGRKPHLNVAVIGPYSTGKTTLMGHMLLQHNDFTARDFEKMEQIASEKGHSDMKYAWLVESHGRNLTPLKTVDVGRVRMQLPSRFLTLINVPGHPSFAKNFISGVSQADHALMVVYPANEDCDQKTILNQLRICKVAGIKALLVAVNQMERTHPEPYSQQTFEETKTAVSALITKAGFSAAAVRFVPTSGKEGENLVYPSLKMNWWQGPTLAQLLGTLQMPNRLLHKPLRITIDQTFSVKGVGAVVVGTILQGVIQTGQYVKISPVGVVTQARSLHLAIPKEEVQYGLPGDYIALNLRGVNTKSCLPRRLGLITSFMTKEQVTRSIAETKDDKRRWFRLSTVQKEEVRKERKKNAPLYPCSSFTAQVFLFNPIGKVMAGYTPTLHVHNAQVPVRIEEVITILRARHLVCKEMLKEKDAEYSRWFQTVFEEKLYPLGRYAMLNKRREDGEAKQIQKGDMAWIRFTLPKPVALDLFERCQKLGRFVLRDGLHALGGGIILNTFHEGEDKQQVFVDSVEE